MFAHTVGTGATVGHGRPTGHEGADERSDDPSHPGQSSTDSRRAGRVVPSRRTVLGRARAREPPRQSVEESGPAESPRSLAELVEATDEAPPNPTYKLPWFEVIGQSALGPLRPEHWRPLGLGNLFSEGWDEPYAPVPISGTRAAPRQTWINSADGAFYRLFAFYFGYLDGTPGNGTSYLGELFVFTPFSRRLEVAWFLPFVDASHNLLNARGFPYSTTVGDLTIAPRVLLAEDRRYTLTTNLYARLPTGSIVNSNGAATLSPDLEFWVNPVDRFVIRGAVGVTVPTNQTAARQPYLDRSPYSGFNATPSSFTSFDGRLAVGRYITSPESRFFPNLVLYVSSNLHTALSGGNATDFTLTPGFRFGLGNHWYFLGGLDVPLVGPLPSHTQTIFMLVKNF